MRQAAHQTLWPDGQYRPWLIRPSALGDVSFGQEVGAGGAIGGSLVGALTAAGLVAGPVGAIAGAAVGLIATLVSTLFQPNLYKIQASNDANEIEGILNQNLANWLSVPVNQRYASVQAAALAVFDNAWQKYVQLVTPDLPHAPTSISDRQAGSCAYHTAECAGWSGGVYTANQPNQPSGCCWNWFVGYRDPIANDPNVQPDPSAAASTANSITSAISVATGVSSGAILLLAGAGLLLLAVAA